VSGLHPDRLKELGLFLRSRRERLAPRDEDRDPSVRRRTPGLRREEVATEAGVGLSWYTWLEQGRDIRVSAHVLRRVARALQLNGPEVAHTFELAGLRAPDTPPFIATSVNATLQRVLNSLEHIPAYVQNQRWDRIAWNDAALALMGDFATGDIADRNTVWRTFANARVRNYTKDWERIAQVVVAEFHVSIGRDVDQAWLTDFLNRLCAVSPEFRDLWERRAIGARREEKTIIQSAEGPLHLERSVFQIPYDPGLALVMFTPLFDEDSPRRLKLLVEKFKSQRERARRMLQGSGAVKS
jgi:transcriptional regulator with XRE-family HTH domain